MLGFNFQSNKFDNVTDIEIESPSGYLVGDVDGDDMYQLNDVFLMGLHKWVFVSSYTHYNGETYQQWSSIDNLNGNNPQEIHILTNKIIVEIQKPKKRVQYFLLMVIWNKKLQH